MKRKNYKLYIILRIFLILTVFISLIGCSLYSYIKNTILNGLLENTLTIVVNAENINVIIMNIKQAIIIAIESVILLPTLILYKLATDNFTALYVDYLTEINSKRFYDIKIKGNIKEVRITKRPLSLMMIDVDSFKQINDKYGHIVGDKVLKHVSKIIKTNTRVFDICCRFGGDEFVVILPDANEEQAKLIGERIIDKLKECPLILYENDIKFINATISVGIAEWQNDMNIAEFSKCADAALYNSKIDGRNRITSYRKVVNLIV